MSPFNMYPFQTTPRGHLNKKERKCYNEQPFLEGKKNIDKKYYIGLTNNWNLSSGKTFKLDLNI